MTAPNQGYARRWRLHRVDQPTAGADWTVTAPGNAVWRITSFNARLVTGAAVADRIPTLRAGTPAVDWLVVEANQAQPASTTVDHCGHTGSRNVNATGFVFAYGLPAQGLLLRPGNRLRMVTTNVQAADQWSAIALLIDEIPTDFPMAGEYTTVDPEIP